MSITTIADLHTDPKNARKRTQRSGGMIVKSLQEVGASRSIVIDEDGRILAGNGTIEAAGEAGIEKVQVVDTDGETIIAVRRSGLTEEQKVRLAILDNRTSELAEWDTEVLKELSEELDLKDLWNEQEWTELARITPEFEPVGEDEQGRLDRKSEVECPECGHKFAPA